MNQGTIFRIKKFALHDGPGIRTTVFFKGCPLRCPWCHNPEGLEPDPQPMRRRSSTGGEDTIVGRRVSVDDVMGEIVKDQLFYDESCGGVTVSGGEPLAQPRFLEALLAACNDREIHTTLDTSGYAAPETVERMLPRLQLVLFDLKIIDEAEHRARTGVSNRPIIDNLLRIDAACMAYRIRFPLVPGMTDGRENIDGLARLAGRLKWVMGIDLLPFHRIGEDKYRQLGLATTMAGTMPMPGERVADIQHRLASRGFNVTIGG